MTVVEPTTAPDSPVKPSAKQHTLAWPLETSPQYRGTLFDTVWRRVQWITGLLCSLNFLVFWAVPIGGMGQLWKLALCPVLRPIYNVVDDNKTLRKFAARYIYSKEKYADFFAQAIFITISVVLSTTMVFYYQLSYGYLPWWVLFVYYCAWVGFGGRGMGGAYTFAHKEGHDLFMYQPWIRETVGNIFENWIGLFYGNVPHVFTTSHIAIHHKLQAGKGDTFYQWDLNRASLYDFMYFVFRVLLHCTGPSSLIHFKQRGMEKHYNQLLRGCITYWVFFPVLLFTITRSWTFLFFIWLQPCLCMSYFLALINYGFHAFIEFDENGKHVECVNSLAIIDGEDDQFGEDDHMAHHYATRVYWRDLPAYQASRKDEFVQHHASVFKKLSIVELSIYCVLGKFDILADYYIDHSGKLTKADIAKMLGERARRIEP